MTKLEKIAHEIIDELNYQCNSTSQNEFAQKVGVARSYIGAFVDGSRDPGGLTIKKLLQIFPYCEIKINGVATTDSIDEKIQKELIVLIETLSKEDQKLALRVLKALFGRS